MLRPLPVNDGFLCYVGFCFRRVARHAKQLQVIFSVLTTVDKRGFVVEGRAQLANDGECADRANPTGPTMHTLLDP
jgi:hypothetical protein